VLLYAQQAAPVVAKIAVQRRVAVIQAASNHVNALPALLAARSLGIPFQYEMRGLWELTRVSRTPDYEDSQAYRQGLGLESLVARHSDRLLVISEQLGAYVHENWGIPVERLALLPNCIDPARIAPSDNQRAESTTIGYAGSLMSYEGLDTLIKAISLLAERGVDVRAHIVGDGESKGALEKQVQRLGLSDHIRFWGRVTPESARDIVGRCALVCIPRKPFQVCELIPPIKLVEALAMAKPVIVPDLPVFRDELGADPAGYRFFTGGDVQRTCKGIQIAI
jgi:glycosyltransferase involved in cell wall biosynthesis